MQGEAPQPEASAWQSETKKQGVEMCEQTYWGDGGPKDRGPTKGLPSTLPWGGPGCTLTSIC